MEEIGEKKQEQQETPIRFSTKKVKKWNLSKVKSIKVRKDALGEATRKEKERVGKERIQASFFPSP